MIKIRTYWADSVFKKVGKHTSRETFRLLDSLPEWAFVDNNLVPKEQFVDNLANLILSIEQTGETLREARKMFSPGSIAETWFPGEYGLLRQSYIEERKKLKKQLELIHLLFRTK